MKRVEITSRVIDVETGHIDEEQTVSTNLVSTREFSEVLDVHTLNAIEALLAGNAPSRPPAYVDGYELALERVATMRDAVLERLDKEMNARRANELDPELDSMLPEIEP
jgi:hypothetical protein